MSLQYLLLLATMMSSECQISVFLLLIGYFSVMGESLPFKGRKACCPFGLLMSLVPLNPWWLLVRKQNIFLFPKVIWDERWRQRAQNKVWVVDRNGNLFLKFWWVLVWLWENCDTTKRLMSPTPSADFYDDNDWEHMALWSPLQPRG